MAVNNNIKLRNLAMLLILDGVGVNPSKANNAVLQANTPRLDEYFSKHPHTVLEASGEAVGLPPGQMGNSEVGHMTIGCGAIIKQDLIRINDAIADGSLFEMSPLLRAIDKAKRKRRAHTFNRFGFRWRCAFAYRSCHRINQTMP